MRDLYSIPLLVFYLMAFYLLVPMGDYFDLEYSYPELDLYGFGWVFYEYIQYPLPYSRPEFFPIYDSSTKFNDLNYTVVLYFIFLAFAIFLLWLFSSQHDRNRLLFFCSIPSVVYVLSIPSVYGLVVLLYLSCFILRNKISVIFPFLVLAYIEFGYFVISFGFYVVFLLLNSSVRFRNIVFAAFSVLALVAAFETLGLSIVDKIASAAGYNRVEDHPILFRLIFSVTTFFLVTAGGITSIFSLGSVAVYLLYKISRRQVQMSLLSLGLLSAYVISVLIAPAYLYSKYYFFGLLLLLAAFKFTSFNKVWLSQLVCFLSIVELGIYRFHG